MLRIMEVSNRHIGLTLLALAVALPAAADTRFRVAQMTRNDVPFGKGQCDIRLQVDNEVEVAIRRDFVSIRTISGRDARDDGSECNAPLPDRDLRDFNFEVLDRRNDIRLLSEPSRRNDFTAIVRIRDGEGGYGRYHFRLSWAMTGLNDRPGYRDEGPGPRFGGDGQFAWNNPVHFASPGRGASNLTGFGAQRLSDATVDIDRGGRVIVTFRTDRGRPLTFTGFVTSRDHDTIKADVAADDAMMNLRGPMYITVGGRENIYRINLDATNGRDRLRVDWDRR